MSGPGETHYERAPSRAGETYGEAPDATAGETFREEPGAETRQWVRVNLPPDLARRYRVERTLTRGAQADMVVVADTTEGASRVVKLYTDDLPVDVFDLLDRIRRDPASVGHVVRVYDTGHSGGHAYEVQEYYGHGSLRDALTNGERVDPVGTLRQLAAGLTFLHAYAYHRDLKPENILVTSLRPLGLVIGDFGLARDMQGGTVLHTQGGTPAYEPPEASRFEASAAGDWWSVGMIVAEVALGHHPLAERGADGSWSLPARKHIPSQVYDHGVDVSGIADERLRNACRGLLVRHRKRRWGATEVSDWLAGRDPVVPDDVHPDGKAAPPAAPKVAPVAFAGARYETPEALAEAFQARWEAAVEQLFQLRDRRWLASLATFLDGHGRVEAARIAAGGAATPAEIGPKMAKLLLDLDPETLRPTFDGIALTPAGLQDEAQAVMRGERSGLGLAQIRQGRILRIWASLPGVVDGRNVDDGWWHSCRDLDEIAGRVQASSVPVPAQAIERSRARLLLYYLDRRYRADIRKDLKTARRGAAKSTPWWNALAAEGEASPAASVLAVVTASEAERVAKEDAARRAQQAGNATVENPFVAPRPQRRGWPTPTALGPAPGAWLPAMAAGVAGLHVWVMESYGGKIRLYGLAVEGSPASTSYADVEFFDQVSAARSQIVAAVGAFVVMQWVISRVRRSDMRPAAAFLLTLGTCAVNAAAALALAACCAIAFMLGTAAGDYEDLGFPAGYLPGWCLGLAAAHVLVLLAAGVLLFDAVRRLLRVVFGAKVITA